jgi:riboflavin synthase
MFTGIVEEIGKVKSAKPGQLTFSAGKVIEGLALGGSIAVNGVCLTAIEIKADTFTVDVMPETLRRSNLGALKIGDPVDLERPMRLGGELGGHLVEGHVDGTGKIVSIKPEGDAILMGFEAPSDVMKYVVEKGFIAIDGISLTVVNRNDGSFTVSLVQTTQRWTILGKKRIGDIVNLEADIIAKYVERLVAPGKQGITQQFLKEQGF